MDYKKIKVALNLRAYHEQLESQSVFGDEEEKAKATAGAIADANTDATKAYAALTAGEKTKFNEIKDNRVKLVGKVPDFVKEFDTPNKIKAQKIFLRGYLGRAYQYLDENPQKYNGERMRVYLSPELNSYVEFNVADYLYHLPNSGGLEKGGCIVWLRAKCPKRDQDGNEIPGETDIDLTYGGHGYELGKTKHYIDGDMLGSDNYGGATVAGCRGQLTPTCPGKGCGPQTPTCPGKGCAQQTPTCPGKGCDGGGGNAIYDKYATVIGCDEWDFRNKYNPYRP